jgi:hypothetical protein
VTADIADEPLLETSVAYEPLQDGEIRLLRLLPGSGEMGVRYELIQLPWLPEPNSMALAGM